MSATTTTTTDPVQSALDREREMLEDLRACTTPFTYKPGKLYRSYHIRTLHFAIHLGDRTVKVAPGDIIMFVEKKPINERRSLFVFLTAQGHRVSWLDTAPVGKEPHLYFKEVQ